MNVKDEKIIKWWNQGCNAGKIARKLGMPGNLQRVKDGLVREKLIKSTDEIGPESVRLTNC